MRSPLLSVAPLRGAVRSASVAIAILELGLALGMALALGSSAQANSLAVALPLEAAPRPPELKRAPDPDLRLEGLWLEGLRLEREEQLLESSRRWVALSEALRQSAFLHWRIARNYWRHAERLPVDDKAGRLEYFGKADDWAGQALVIDSQCGECVLWKLAAMGRVATTSGVVQSASMARPISEMIERGIALRPSHTDGDRNNTLANLYYAGSAFYRIVPDWFFVEWMIGVRGDKYRALDYIQKALALTSDRVDYLVELGAVLLCIGDQEHDAARLVEGRDAMRRAMKSPDFQSTDELDLEHAQILLAQPERACGYSRDGWIDLTEASAVSAGSK